MARADPPVSERLDRSGLIQGLGAYAMWGLLPLYFWLIADVRADEVVAMRILWSFGLLALLVLALRRGQAVIDALRNPRAVRLLTVSAALISANWLIYVWAIHNGHVLETSLGYFLNPLLNVVLGVALLRERLGTAQKVAVGFAAAGVAVLAVGAGGGIWISLSLALSFGFYGFVRKVAPVASFEGLAIETMLLAPFAAGYAAWLASHGGLSFGQTSFSTVALALSGIATATPLLLFAGAARRLPLSVLGLLQYLAPTLQFLLAVLFFGEHMTLAHMICFGLIWTGLAIFAGAGIVASRRAA
jgi:chloramphenicol-sensitive protein RarD